MEDQIGQTASVGSRSRVGLGNVYERASGCCRLPDKWQTGMLVVHHL